MSVAPSSGPITKSLSLLITRLPSWVVSICASGKPGCNKNGGQGRDSSPIVYYIYHSRWDTHAHRLADFVEEDPILEVYPGKIESGRG